jgi:hypothetical protein
VKTMKDEESENTMSDYRTRCRLWKRAKRLRVTSGAHLTQGPGRFQRSRHRFGVWSLHPHRDP